MNRLRTGTQNAPRCRRKALALVAAALLASGARAASTGSLDPEFAKLPFEEWAAERKPAQLRWSVEIPPAILSTHQRLMLRTFIRVDAREVEKRHVMTFVQVQDGAGHVWQNHASLHAAAVAHYAFVLPGDYTVSVAACDTSTQEHSLTVRRIHVTPLKNDPLPEVWSGLPNVEFISSVGEPPDVWYLPEIDSHLQFEAPLQRPVHLHVIVNTTPARAGSVAALRGNMSLLMPALKILSGLRIPRVATDVALLDLTKRRVVFEQLGVQRLNWESIRGTFAESNPGMIDVQTLQGQWKMRNFFRDQIAKRLQGGSKDRGNKALNVVVVLSGPAFLPDQEAFEEEAWQADPDDRLIYIRYRARPALPRTRIRPGMRPPRPVQPVDYAMPADDLEKTVEPMRARIFDATSPDEFRRILAVVIQQIADKQAE